MKAVPATASRFLFKTKHLLLSWIVEAEQSKCWKVSYLHVNGPYIHFSYSPMNQKYNASLSPKKSLTPAVRYVVAGDEK